MLLEVKDLEAGYGRKKVVFGVSLGIGEGEIVALFGHNGAGKTTTLKTIFGVLKPMSGKVFFDGKDITHHTPSQSVKMGITFCPQERFVFPDLNVRENLELATYSLEGGSHEERFEMIYRLFPILKEREKQIAGTLSGGERRMLSIGMMLLMNPRLMLLDEPSLGLAPFLVQQIMDTVKNIADELGVSILLVEQNVKQALRIANRAYVMKMGRIILEEDARKLLDRGEWWDLF